MSKSKNTLEVLLGSRARLKMLKFLFRNMNMGFTAKELAARIQEPLPIARKEIKNFLEIGLLKFKK